MKNRKSNMLKKAIAISGGLAVVAAATLGYMHWEYRTIKTSTLSVFNDRLAGMKVVYAADFQYDLSWEESKMQTELFQSAIDAIMEQKPDVILLGGDYVTYPASAPAAIPLLRQLSAPYGVFGVFGNHDKSVEAKLLKGLSDVITFLRNDTVLIPYNGKTLAVHGVEDLWMGDPTVENFSKGEADYSILLSHNPDFFGKLEQSEREQFDLTLSGHVHAGQITLFGICGFPPVLSSVTRNGEKYRYGIKDDGGSLIYTTSGLGGRVFGMPLRLGAQPEIVVIT